MDHGTDRDVALAMVSALDTCAELIAGINDNLYVAHITTQPTDQSGDIGDTAYFTVVANNVAAYQWQFKRPDSSWSNSSSTGYNTATLEVEIQAGRYGYKYRCRVTGKDGSYVYSNEAELKEPEAEG